ncbi:MAG: ribonuclease P protein component, partial [Flavobacteriales bacterium]|nr:ribonuclease P protein component [Flavobacteriales bacterium]
MSNLLTFVVMSHTFRKTERLTHKKLIELTFKEGEKVKAFPFLFVYRWTEPRSESPVQVMMSVGKRNFKKAVDRNKIKRLMKEVYRLNKPNIATSESPESQLSLIIVYV